MNVHYYRNLSNYLACRQRIFLPVGFFLRSKDQLALSDVVHIHEFRSLLTVSAHHSLRSLKAPYILSAHGGLQRLGKESAKAVFDRLWGNKILKDAAGICAVSPLEENEARMLGIDEGRIHRFPSPIDADLFRNLPPQGAFASRWKLGSKQIVLYLGRLHWVKGPDILIEGLELLRDFSNLHVVFAGPDDGAESKLREIITKRKLTGRITFTGFLDDNEKLKALVDSSVVVIPSRREGFPVTLLEALACKKPVVASSACVLGDWLQGRAAWSTFENGDPGDLAKKLRGSLIDCGASSQLSETQDFILNEFSADAVAGRAEALYQTLL
jgi:glycosyltransferase involved in cell wall biosynthesis